MKFSLAIGLSITAGLWAQAPGTPAVTLEQDLSPETVVATADGKNITYGELKTVLSNLPPQTQQAALKDRKNFVHQYAFLKRLTELAEQSKLDQKSPYRDALAYGRMQVLSQAAINEHYQTITVTPEEQRKYYETNRDRYTQAQVKVIYIPFTATPPPQTDPKAKKPLNEAEAKAKAESLVKEIRGGADFVKLVKENSEDAASKAKDGDFGTIRKSDNIPQAIKAVVFALKPGDVSDPVRQPNGFYVFRVEQITEQPYDAVKGSIFTELKSERVNEWIKKTHDSIDIKVENQAFFTPQTRQLEIPAAPGVAQPAAKPKPAAVPQPAAK